MIDVLEERRLLAAHTFTVDSNVLHMANFTSIQAAVNAASAGDTIKVAAGLYDEAVTVNKTLTIVGAQTSNARTRIIDAAHESIVEAPDSSAGFNLQANNIILKGFTIRPQAAAITSVDGVITNALYSGEQILSNVLTGDTIGVYLNSGGAKATVVSGNAFFANNFAGAAAGNGIYSDQGLKNARIDHNYFTGDTNASIILVGGNGTFSSLSTHSNVHITDNIISNDASIIAVNMVNSEIEENQITNPVGSGIFFGGAVTNTSVEENTLRGNAASFTGINLRTDDVNYNVAHTPNGAPIANSNDRIEENQVTGFGDSGIRLRDGANGILVVGNKLFHNGTGGDSTTGDGISIEDSYSNIIKCNEIAFNRRDGIRLSNAQGNTVSHNDVDDNTEDGIQLTGGSVGNIVSQNSIGRNARDGIRVDDALSIGNTFAHNHAFSNGVFDYDDLTTGGGTAGTGNTWKHNRGTTQNVVGLIN